MVDRPNDSEPCHHHRLTQRCFVCEPYGSHAGEHLVWEETAQQDTAKSEDRTHGYEDELPSLNKPAVETVSVAQLPFYNEAYDRGFAAGRADAQDEAEKRGYAMGLQDGNLRSGFGQGASEDHNERMREEGDARTLAACIEKAEEHAVGHRAIGLMPDASEGCEILVEAFRLELGDRSSALAKREAAAEERAREVEGAALRRIAELEAERNDLRDGFEAECRAWKRAVDERDALRAGVARLTEELGAANVRVRTLVEDYDALERRIGVRIEVRHDNAEAALARRERAVCAPLRVLLERAETWVSMALEYESTEGEARELLNDIAAALQGGTDGEA